MAEKEYRRLTRSRRRRKRFLLDVDIARSSLWLGTDHLLSIASTRYTDEYKRFYFKDIQAITICKNRRREIWNFALSVLLLIALLTFAYLANTQSGGFPAGILVLLIVGVPLVLNNLLGPTCTVHLRTAVQIEELPSLSRIARTQKVLERIRPLIAAAQGQIDREDVSARIKDMIQSSTAVASTEYLQGSATQSHVDIAG
jgi:hypothetical protein